VELLAQIPPIERMDASLSSLKACKCASVLKGKFLCICFKTKAPWVGVI